LLIERTQVRSSTYALVVLARRFGAASSAMSVLVRCERGEN
jgi:hypothetical protein